MYITIDGIDGSGKSTLALGIAKGLTKYGLASYLTKEPGADNEFCQNIRKIVLQSTTKVDPYAEFFAFMADRMQHLNRVVAIEELGTEIVISDRSMLSGACYGMALGLDQEFIDTVVEATKVRAPDIAFISSASSEFVSSVMLGRNLDRIESRPQEFKDSIANGFATLPFEFAKSWNISRLPPTNTLDREELVEVAIKEIMAKL